MQQGIVKIGAAAQMLGVSLNTLRNGEQSGELLPVRRSQGGTRYDAMSDILGCEVGRYAEALLCACFKSRSESRFGGVLCGERLAVRDDKGFRIGHHLSQERVAGVVGVDFCVAE